MAIRVQPQDFDIGVELAALTKRRHNIGGLCSFVGLVRDMAKDKSIKSMTLEHYPSMTEKAISVIESEAHKRWPLEGTLIIHRYGKLKPGDQIVLVAAASSHRKAAFEACHFLIDWLKTQAPFWKLEETSKGSQWVNARQSDEQAATRWGTSTSNIQNPKK